MLTFGKHVLGGTACLLALLTGPLAEAGDSAPLRMQPASAPVQLAAANPCNPCAANPCAAKMNPCAAKMNPCAAKTNPCAAKMNPCAAKMNPCAAKMNPCAARMNPCAAMNPCNPCAGMQAKASQVTRPVGSARYRAPRSELVRAGRALWNDPTLSTNGLTCNGCHMNNQAFLASFMKQYPHEVAMAKGLGIHEIQIDEMVQLCMVNPMAAEPLPWDSKELAALAAYSVDVAQQNYIAAAANNPCMAKRANPCNPCGAAMNPCNPCAAKAMNPCNPCAANPCAARMNPCNPCGRR